MDMFDFFFPEQAQAKHLRRLAAQQKSASTVSHVQSAGDIAALQADVRFLSLVVAILLKRLGETATLSLADVQDLIDEVDALDGTADGGLDPGVLRGLIGVLKADELVGNSPPENPLAEHSSEFEAIADMHRRYRQ